MAALRDALTAAIAGRGSLMLIGGEAGIGKTTLAESIFAGALAAGALVLVGRCYDLSETPPHGPWREAFAQARRGGVVPPDLAGSAATSQATLFAAVREWLATQAAEQPLVLLLDDLHWADLASLDLLRVIGRQLADLPILVRETRAHRLDLRPLGGVAIRALVAQHYHLTPDDEARLVPYLTARAEGNPFFLSELLRALEETGILRPADADGWALGSLDQLPVPRLLRQVTDGRLARLEGTTREALGAAAVIGQVVPFTLWTALTGRDEPALLDAAAEAVAARLLEETPDGTGVRFVHALTREAVYEGIRPTHRRTLHQQAAEALLTTPAPDPDAVASHLLRAGDPRAAEWLRRAGDRAHRAYAWLSAAARYEAALALSEQGGIEPWERGWVLFRLARLRRFADAPGALPRMEEAVRLAEQAGDRFLAAHARLGVGHLRCLAGDFRRGVPEMEAGMKAVEALPEPERVRQAQLDPTDRSIDWGTIIAYYAILGHYARAFAVGEPYIAVAPSPDDVHHLGAAPHADAQFGLGLAYAALGQPDEARHMFAQSRAGLRAVDHQLMVGMVSAFELSRVTIPYRTQHQDERRTIAAEGPSVGLQALMGWPDDRPSLWQLPLLVIEGRWHEIKSSISAPGFSNPAKLWQTTMLALVAREQGDADLAWYYVRRALPEGPATEPGWVEYLEILHFQRLAAALAADAGNLSTARAWLGAHDRWLAWNGTILGRAEGQLGWAAYHRTADDHDRAREDARQALAHASNPRQPLVLLAAHRFLGELDTDAGRHEDAASHLHRSLALAEACVAPYERALTLLALAELRAATGERDSSTTALGEARTLLDPLGARPALTRADALAARLAAVPAANTFGLTARELEVLRLVAQGLPNAEIAGQLFLSQRTVEQHLRATYGKLDVPSRTAAVRAATERGLL